MKIGRTQFVVGEEGNGEQTQTYTHTHTHTHTHSVPRDTQVAWSHGQGSDAISTHVSVDRPLTKLMGYVPLENAVWG